MDTDTSAGNDPRSRQIHTHGGDLVRRDKLIYGDEIHGDKVVGDKVVYQGPTYPHLNYRSEVAHLIDFYTQTFVGREREWEHLARFAGQETPGYLLVEAPSGYGKSALMAHLMHRHETGRWDQPPVPELAYFFTRQEGQRNTPVAFLQAINSQLLGTLKQPGGVPADLSLLRNQFSQLWSQALEAANRDKPLLLLVDGLDEMASGEVTIAHLLPADLAPYVHIVVFSRPNPEPLRQVTLEHPFSKADVLRLHTFEERDIEALLREYDAAGETAAHLALRVLAMTKGEPLFARFVCQEVADEGEIALVRLEREPPADVEAYFRQQFRQLDKLAEGDHTWEILGLLAVALGGIMVEEIADALGLGKRQARKAIEPIMRFLLGETRLELMHLQLRKVLAEDFSTNEQAVHRQRLLDWCQSYDVRGWPDDTPDYILAHYAQHLAEAGQIDALYTLVESRDWTSAKYVDTPWADSLVQDLQLASTAAAGRGIEVWPRSMAYQLRRTLVEDLMSRLSDEVVVFMAKLGRVDQALHYAKRHPGRSFQLYHGVAEVITESRPDKALKILLQSIRFFDHGSLLNRYGARLVVAKTILENKEILAKVPSAAQQARNLVKEAERMQPDIPDSDRQSYQARYSCPMLVLTGRLSEAKRLANSLTLANKSQALCRISLALPPGHPEKIPLVERALSILGPAERDAETITREVQAVVTLLPHVDNRRQAQLVQTLVSLEDELHSIGAASYPRPRPSWSWVIENIADFDLEKAKDILFNSKWNSRWRDTWPALIRQIALLDPSEALGIAENQFSHHADYSLVIADIIRVVAVQFGNTAEAEELISQYSKQLSGSFRRVSEAYLALAEAYLAQGNRRKAEEMFDEQVFIISDRGVRRGRNDLLAAMVQRSSVLDSCEVEVVFDHLQDVGEGRLYNPERLLGDIASRQGRIDLIETYGLGLGARIGAAYATASRDPGLAKQLCAKWNLWNRMKKWQASRLDVFIRAVEARQDCSRLEDLVSCFDGEGAPHHICKNMKALPAALYWLIQEDQIDSGEAKRIVERVYPVLLNWKCPEGKEDCECYAGSERLLGDLTAITARLDRDRAEQMAASLLSPSARVSTLKGIACYTEPDDRLIESIVEFSQEAFSEPLDLAASYLDLAANVLPPEKRSWITRLIQLAEPLIDDRAWSPPLRKLKIKRAQASMKLVDGLDQFAHVRNAVDNIGGSLKDKLGCLDVLAERAKGWPQEEKRTLLWQIWELATFKRVEDVEALIAFTVPILESLVDDEAEMFWRLYDHVEWAYQDLPRLNATQDGIC